MNILERLKKLFKLKQEEVKKTTTTISLYDVSDIVLPNISDLNEDQKKNLFKYKNEIQLDNLESILKYNEKVSKEGEELSKLLIKILYDLNEIIRKDNKTEKELQEIDINTSIKSQKIMVIRELLQRLKEDCDIRALAIQDVATEYEKKEHKFIEIFSRAARIKRNMKLKSLQEAETRSKITIKTIMQQLGAVNNAILSNDTYRNRMNVYSSITDNNKKNNIRKSIYVSKLEFYVDVAKQLNYKFTRLSEITNLLKKDLTSDVEQQIINNFAITEVELDKFIIENKDKMISEYISKIVELKDIEITHENKNKLLEEAEYLQVILEVFKEYIAEPYREEIYNIKFNILSFDINNQSENYSKFQMYLPRDDYYKEKDHYFKIIFKKINDINQGISPFAWELQDEGKLKKMIKLLDPYFKSIDGKYRYEDILFDREKLALLLAFDSIRNFNNFFKEFKYSTRGYEVKTSIILPWYNFEWDRYLPLETIYTLYEIDGKEKPKFYDIYKLYHKEVYIPGRAPNFSEDIYYFPEGIKYNHENNKFNVDKLLYYIREKSNGKIVVFPSSLERISGDIFGDVKIRNVVLNNRLQYIGEKVFRKQHLEKIIFPQNIHDIDQNSLNFSCVKEIEFRDFQDSKLLYNLLYENTEQYKNIIKQLFHIVYSNDSEKYKEYSKNRTIVSIFQKIILYDKEKRIEITYSEIYYAINKSPGSNWDYVDKVRYYLSELIEEKTGINIKEYQQENYNHKK